MLCRISEERGANGAQESLAGSAKPPAEQQGRPQHRPLRTRAAEPPHLQAQTGSIKPVTPKILTVTANAQRMRPSNSREALQQGKRVMGRAWPTRTTPRSGWTRARSGCWVPARSWLAAAKEAQSTIQTKLEDMEVFKSSQGASRAILLSASVCATHEAV